MAASSVAHFPVLHLQKKALAGLSFEPTENPMAGSPLLTVVFSVKKFTFIDFDDYGAPLPVDIHTLPTDYIRKLQKLYNIT